MKYRQSFVTNSSSSSYTCSLCGETASGWDLCLSEAEMLECVNGHTICESHFDRKWLDEMMEKFEDEESPDFNEEWRYEFSEKFCPVCNFTKLLGDDIVKYLIKYKNLNIEEIRKEILEKFDSYPDFQEKISN